MKQTALAYDLAWIGFLCLIVLLAWGVEALRAARRDARRDKDRRGDPSSGK